MICGDSLVSCRLNLVFVIRSASTSYLKRLEVGSYRYHLSDPISLPEIPRWVLTRVGWVRLGVYVCVCVIINDKPSRCSVVESVDLTQRALGSFSSSPPASPFEISLFPLREYCSSFRPFLLNLLFRDVFSNLTLSLFQSPTSRFNKSNVNILCSFHFLDIMNFSK